jgi:regulator of RNase E activity RraA
MTITQHTRTHIILSAETLKAFSDVPAAVASDALNRGGTLAGQINPLRPEMRICGQARTVDCPAGDNTPLRAAVRDADEGDVIVCDAKAYEDRAVFGGLMALFAKEQGINGLIIDGAVRDSDEIIDAGLNMFCRAVVPNGPITQGGGTVDAPITCGGQAVRAGDIVIGDADGVTIVPLERAQEVLDACNSILSKEAKLMEDLKKGATLAGYFGLVDVKKV